MTVVLLALGSAALFGAMTVAVRIGLRGVVDPGAAALATVTTATCVALVATLFRHDYHHAWPFLLAGVLAPGGSQILFTLAIAEIGASRTSVAVGAAPLVAVVLAIVFLDEPLRARSCSERWRSSGRILLAVERDRPGHLRARGLFAAGRRRVRHPRQRRARCTPTRARAAAATSWRAPSSQQRGRAVLRRRPS